MPLYLLDTNFFIESYRSGFPMDVVLSFWNKLAALAAEGKVVSLDKVKEEIYRNDDELKAWCEANLPTDFFKDSTSAIAEYASVVTWANSKKDHPYTQPALDVFMDAEEADAWLVAYAKQQNLPLVTNEISAPESKKSVKIPDACLPIGVRCVRPMDMFRELKETI
ncbi:MAG: DUF4411 family protein [Saprospiraceae bacterium]|nr:DUF4411 family protein [Saprospiraceae bacterium]